MEKAELKELLRESTEKVLFELGKILDKNSSLYNELIILWKRHDDIEREIRLGTISFEESSRENNKVTDSVLKLIDSIKNHEQKVNLIKRDIPIEDAIEWLENVLVGQECELEESEEDIEKRKIRQLFHIEEVNIKDDGGFSILVKYQYRSHTSNKRHSYNTINIHMIHIVGNFQDVGSINIKKIESEGSIYVLVILATNYKKLFQIKSESRYFDSMKEIERKENDFYEREFSLHLKELELATKVKNAIDYLAIHFGRKEDAF